ncbi:TetR/AcrR family transcriptional regulator [Sphingomonas koreensis]|nr:TetR/AcrR family transcriptional regulator [Sphingomonas koreensis]
MTVREIRRQAAIERMADHVLANGLAGATLRPLAAAVGTSDRMLLYYFTDKEDLLTSVLERIAARLLQQLDRAIPAGSPQPFNTLLDQVWTVLGSDNLKPYMHVWLDLISAAARGIQPHRHVAGMIADGYLAWVASHLASPSDRSPLVSAPLFLAIFEGLYLFDALGRPGIARAAREDILSVLSRL